MKVFDIINFNGSILDTVFAKDERQALCIYLTNHEELNDMMLWKSADNSNAWKLAEYDNEDEFIYARG